jgi:hypothetical protein
MQQRVYMKAQFSILDAELESSTELFRACMSEPPLKRARLHLAACSEIEDHPASIEDHPASAAFDDLPGSYCAF